MLPELSSTWQIVLFSFFIFEWLLRLIMLYQVPRRQSPATANGWLLLIMLFPTLGTILYVSFASPKLPQVRRAKQRAVDQLTQEQLTHLQKQHPKLFTKVANIDHQSLARLGTVLGGLPPMTGNEVQLIDDYNEAFQQIVGAIDRAQEYVHIEYYLIVEDKVTEPLFAAIERARKRGVDVRVLYDRLVSRGYPNYKHMLKRLDDAGVVHHEMIPLSLIPGKNFTRPDLRNHRKIVVIDGDVAFTGSQNIVQKNYHRKDELRYEELIVEIKGPAVWQLNTVFRSDWFPETGDPLSHLVESTDVNPGSGSVTLQALPSGPSHEEENNLRFYTSMVHAAKKRVGIVVPYFIPDESFLDAVTTAAQRGVEVTIINSEIIDKPLIGRSQRSYYEELLQAGVQVYLYKKPVFLHTKQVIIDDDLAIIGSSNLDIRSFALDLELNLIIYDKNTVTKLAGIEARYLERSSKVTLASWLKRPFRHKIVESLARIAAPLQ